MEEIVITIPVYATMARPPLSALALLEEARQPVLLGRGSTKAATPKSVSCTQTREKGTRLDVNVEYVMSCSTTCNFMFYLSRIWLRPFLKDLEISQ